jgi:hypothetical protein
MRRIRPILTAITRSPDRAAANRRDRSIPLLPQRATRLRPLRVVHRHKL